MSPQDQIFAMTDIHPLQSIGTNTENTPATRVRAVARVLLAAALFGGLQQAPAQQPTEPIRELEPFVTVGERIEESDRIVPHRPVDSVFGMGLELVELPRAVSVIGPETIERLGLADVNDLPRAVPGASVLNYFGVPGIPTTRGLPTSIAFNGMQRVWNRNGYPTSFGSLEAMDYVRGPAPGTISASSPGGFVNFIPKSPYFDRFRGEAAFTVGSHRKFVTRIDAGGPLELANKDVAWRLSLTHQDADSYFHGIFNDYLSVYGAFKVQLAPNVSLFGGGEIYRHRSKENPGWNRPTQNLIDNGLYLIGSPAEDLTGTTVTFPGPFGGDVTVTNSTPGWVSREALETTAPFGGIRGTFARGAAFNPAALSPSQAASLQYLAGLDNPTGATVPLSRRTVLTDPDDFANADTHLAFLDLEFAPGDDLRITNKLFLDGYTREKRSTYGYAEYGRNLTLENKLLVETRMDALAGLDFAFGVSVRHEDALAMTDFTVEPFGRRDLSQPATANDRLAAGGLLDQDGLPFWDPFGSHDSQLWTFGAFATTAARITDAFAVFASGRIDHATWRRARPGAVQSAPGAPAGARLPGGGKTYSNVSLSPTVQLFPGVVGYATWQVGTAFQGYYVSGSVNAGDANFQESSLVELGLKAHLFDGRLFAGVAAYHQDLVHFDTRGGQLHPQRGRGVEAELLFEPGDGWSLIANATWQEHFFRSETIPGGFVPLTEAEYLQYGGGAYLDFGGRPNPGGPRYGIPHLSGNLMAQYAFANGLRIAVGPSYSASVWGNPDKTFRLPRARVWNARIAWRRGAWETSLAVRNFTSERYFLPQEPFSANAILLPAEPISWEVTLRRRF